MKMRTIDQAYEFVKGQDPSSALTKHALRRLVISGTLPSVKLGIKYLVNLEVLECFLANSISVTVPSGSVRRIMK